MIIVTVEQHGDVFWIVDMPSGMDSMGPYTTRIEALQDARGVSRFLVMLDKEKRNVLELNK